MQNGKKITHQVINKIERWQERSPFLILILAAIVGTFTGLLGSCFQICINSIIAWRLDFSYFSTESSLFKYGLIFCLSGLMGAFAYYLVKKLAPESSGSGIPEIEGALLDLRPVRWWRVLPVKFLGGLAALGSGMILGREGPTVQIGSNIGKMVSDTFQLKNRELQHTLVSAGAGAGITTAFNAPLGGILFVIEEMHSEFKYTKSSVKAVFVGCVFACLMYYFVIGTSPILSISPIKAVPLNSLWLYLIFGFILGALASVSNYLILKTRESLDVLYSKKWLYFIITGSLIAAFLGLLSLFYPDLTGDGFNIVHSVVSGFYSLYPLLIIFVLRFLLTVICFGSGAPGGIFSPTIALGTVAGVLFGYVAQMLFPHYSMDLSACAIIGMAGLFAGSIRAPLTGIMIVIEMTNGYALILPLILTCLSSTFMAQTLGSNPLYASILEYTLSKSANKEN